MMTFYDSRRHSGSLSRRRISGARAAAASSPSSWPFSIEWNTAPSERAATFSAHFFKLGSAAAACAASNLNRPTDACSSPLLAGRDKDLEVSGHWVHITCEPETGEGQTRTKASTLMYQLVLLYSSPWFIGRPFIRLALALEGSSAHFYVATGYPNQTWFLIIGPICFKGNSMSWL